MGKEKKIPSIINLEIGYRLLYLYHRIKKFKAVDMLTVKHYKGKSSQNFSCGVRSFSHFLFTYTVTFVKKYSRACLDLLWVKS